MTCWQKWFIYYTVPNIPKAQTEELLIPYPSPIWTVLPELLKDRPAIWQSDYYFPFFLNKPTTWTYRAMKSQGYSAACICKYEFEAWRLHLISFSRRKNLLHSCLIFCLQKVADGLGLYHHEPLVHLRRHRKGFGYSCRTLALDQLQKADNGEDHSSWAGNAAWVNSITRYSPSTQCGRFSRRSAPLFEFQRQFGDLPLQPQQDRRHQAEAASKKSAHVDIAWRCGLLKVNPYLLQDGGHYVNPSAVA